MYARALRDICGSMHHSHRSRLIWSDVKIATDLALARLQVVSTWSIMKAQFSTCTVKSKPTIHLSKPAVLIDEKVQIVVKGLPKHRKVTLHSLLNDSGKLFAACGHYTSNEMGEVDTFQQVSHGGTFEGVEPMGLFWSMKPQGNERPRRILKEDVTTPFDVNIALLDGFLKFEDLPWSKGFECLDECILQRHYMVPGARRIPIREKGIYGTLFLPPGEGPFPAVIDIFGLTGGILELRAPLLASHGIAVLSLAYVDMGGLPKDDSGLDFNYFLNAFDWLAAHPSVDATAMGGVSTCVGGGFVGIVAMKRPSMKCFVCINNTYFPIGKEQVIEGEQIKVVDFLLEHRRRTAAGIVFRDVYDHLELDFIPMWRHGIKVLQIHGTDDHAVPSYMAKKFQKAVPPEFQSNFTHIEYPGAGHLIEPPYMPLCPSSYNSIINFYLLWGGEPKPHADAQEDSWGKILSFLHTHLQNDSKTHVIPQTVSY